MEEKYLGFPDGFNRLVDDIHFEEGRFPSREAKAAYIWMQLVLLIHY